MENLIKYYINNKMINASEHMSDIDGMFFELKFMEEMIGIVNSFFNIKITLDDIIF